MPSSCPNAIHLNDKIKTKSQELCTTKYAHWLTSRSLLPKNSSKRKQRTAVCGPPFGAVRLAVFENFSILAGLGAQ